MQIAIIGTEIFQINLKTEMVVLKKIEVEEEKKAARSSCHQ